MSNAKFEWCHKDIWTLTGKCFIVQVSRHLGSRDPAIGEGPNRWAMYAYIYPRHWHFIRFDLSKEDMWQDACNALPLHGGPSFLRFHRDHSGEITSAQVGADYHHLYDDHFTRMATKDEAKSVFFDAEELHLWLSGSNASGSGE